jgi:hypothetical protein
MLSSDPEPPFQIPAPLTLDDLLAAATEAVEVQRRYRHGLSEYVAGTLEAAGCNLLAGHDGADVQMRRALARSVVCFLPDSDLAWLLGVASEQAA